VLRWRAVVDADGLVEADEWSAAGEAGGELPVLGDDVMEYWKASSQNGGAAARR
jgi:hypothetical protein